MAKVDPYKFVLTKKSDIELRPAMAGVYYSGGHEYATDAHVALIQKSQYQKSYEGKVINKKGEVIKGKFPDVLRVMPDEQVMKCYRFDLGKLERELSSRKQTKETAAAKIIFRPEGSSIKVDTTSSDYYGNGQLIEPNGVTAVNMWLFKRSILPFMKTNGTAELYLDPHHSDYRAILVKGKDARALIMPVLSSDGEKIKYNLPEDILITTVPVKTDKMTYSDVFVAKSIKSQKKTNNKNSNMKKSPCTKVKSSKTKTSASNTVQRASNILRKQKKEYSCMFVSETKKGGNTRAAAKRAAASYKKKYGATPTARWKNALKAAK